MSSQTSDAFAIPKSSLRRAGLALAGIVVAIVVIVAVLAAYHAMSAGDGLSSNINTNEYQAVFLSNNQVYFGKLSSGGSDFYLLRHVYYLQSQVSPQSGKHPRQTLVHLGNEIHGPEDQMIISRRQILFVENLKPTGQVSKAIPALP